MKPENLVRENIKNLKPYSSARDEFEGVAEVYLDANENPIETGLNRYPDPHQKILKQRIAEIKSVHPSQIFLGNGSDEVIDLIFRIFCEPKQDNIIIHEPTYGMYEVSAGIHDIKVKRVSLSTDFQLDATNILAEVDEHTKLIFICSPNNPSGNDLDPAEIEKILNGTDRIVIIDEAYIDFTKSPSWVKQIKNYDNLIVMQTFSKAWGLAGLRLGMAFSNEKITAFLNKVKPPYNVNILTQIEALKALENKAEIDENIKMIQREKEMLITELNKIDLIRNIFPSSANFLLVKFHRSVEVFNYLTEKGIIVRDRSKNLHCEGSMRVTVGTRAENKKLINALKAFK